MLTDVIGITAAHCVGSDNYTASIFTDYEPNTIQVGYENYKIIVFSTFCTQVLPASDSFQETGGIPVSKYVYKYETGKNEHDIALKLSKPMPGMSSNVVTLSYITPIQGSKLVMAGTGLETNAKLN